MVVKKQVANCFEEGEKKFIPWYDKSLYNIGNYMENQLMLSVM